MEQINYIEGVFKIIIYQGDNNYTVAKFIVNDKEEKMLTVTVNKKNIDEARNYFARTTSELMNHFSVLGSKYKLSLTGEPLEFLKNKSNAIKLLKFDLPSSLVSAILI